LQSAGEELQRDQPDAELTSRWSRPPRQGLILLSCGHLRECHSLPPPLTISACAVEGRIFNLFEQALQESRRQQYGHNGRLRSNHLARPALASVGVWKILAFGGELLHQAFQLRHPASAVL